MDGEEILEEEVTGELAAFSGQGPTVDGRIKPEIIAPGEHVASSLSRFVDTNSIRVTDGGLSQLLNGTSFSSPAAAGAVALLLEQNSFATRAEIRELLLSTASGDEFTAASGALPNGLWGYGKLDIFEACQQQQFIITGIESSGGVLENLSDVITVSPNPTTDVAFVMIDQESVALQGEQSISMQVFDGMGRMVRSIQLNGAKTPIDRNGLSNGIYYFRISSPIQSIATGSWLIH